MRTIWKRAACFTVFTVATALTAVSCTDTATSPPSADAAREASPEKKVSDLREKYGWAGDYHTRALEHSYRHLIKHNAGSLSAAAKCQLADEALKEFTRAYRRNGSPLGVTDVSLTGTACDLSVRKQIIDGPQAASSPRTNELSAGATSLLAQVESAAASDASVAAINAALQGIQNTAASSLPEAEAGAVIAAGEVAKSSVEYWNLYAPAWEEGVSGDGPSTYSREVGNETAAKTVVMAPGNLARSGGESRTRRIIKADVTAFLVTIATSWWAGPIGWDAAAIRAAASSLVAGLFPY